MRLTVEEEEEDEECEGSVEDPRNTKGAGAKEPKLVGSTVLEPRSEVRSEAGRLLRPPSSGPFAPEFLPPAPPPQDSGKQAAYK